MTKKQLKEKLKRTYNINSKLMFIKDLKDSIHCSLYRAKLELADNVWQVSGFNKDFNTLWNLLTKEEKHYLRYKIEVYD